MNAMPSWLVHVDAAEPPASLAALVGAPASLRIADPVDDAERIVDLIVAEASLLAERHTEGDRGRTALSLVLAPLARTAAERAGYRVFVDKAAHEVVQTVLADIGISGAKLGLRLAATYVPQSQITQYAETDWAFIARILAEEGISTWFDDGDSGTALVLGDSMSSHDGIPPPVTARFEEAGGLVRARTISALERTDEVTEDNVHLRDFDVRNPDVLIDGRAGDGSLLWFEYPSFAPTAADAARRAKARLEQLGRFATWLRVESDITRLRPGRIVHIDASEEAASGDFLIVRVEHTFDSATAGGPHVKPYTNTATLVPKAEMAFRPAPPANRIQLDHVETAITTGPAGEEIHVDDLGRVKLRFLWDPSGTTDDRSSAWARATQPMLPGPMLLPRVDWEVPVFFQDGSPDRPFVLGRTMNGQRVAPYGLPGAAAVTALRTESTPFNSAMQEIRLTDDAGAQQLRIQASKDQSVLVGGSRDTTVATDQTHDIGLMLAQVVTGAQAHTVAANQTVSVGTQAATLVKGASSLTVGALQRISVGGNRGVGAKGNYGEFIGAAYLLQANQSNMRVSSAFAQLNGQLLAITGLGFGENVAGARVEIIGAAAQYAIGGTYKDTVTGPKIIHGAAAVEQSGAGIVTKAKIGNLRAATATASAGARITVTAEAIAIDATQISIGPLTIGGSLRISGGTLDVGAPSVVFKSGAKVGA